MAIDLLERYQIRQILTIASDDMLFRLRLLRDPLDASQQRGFSLSETAIAVLAAQLSHLVPDNQPGWRQYYYH